jgi:hypothetical protein
MMNAFANWLEGLPTGFPLAVFTLIAVAVLASI